MSASEPTPYELRFFRGPRRGKGRPRKAHVPGPARPVGGQEKYDADDLSKRISAYQRAHNLRHRRWAICLMLSEACHIAAASDYAKWPELQKKPGLQKKLQQKAREIDAERDRIASND